MDNIIGNLDYIILLILIIILSCAVPFSANKQLNRPVLLYSAAALSGLFPILFPIYLGFIFFKAKNTRVYIYLIILLICLTIQNFLSSKLAENIEFSELYTENVTLEEGDYISIKGEFLKLHADQYVVETYFTIGGTRTVNNKFYYEIVPVNNNSPQKVRVFVSDGVIFYNDLPNKNLVNYERFDAYRAFLKHIDKGVIGKIKATLKPGQGLLFITEASQSSFQSDQKIAKIGSGIFGLLSLILFILTFREIRVRKSRNT